MRASRECPVQTLACVSLPESPNGTTLFTAAGCRDATDAFSTTDLTRAENDTNVPHAVAVAPSPDGTYVATGAASGTEDPTQIYRANQTPSSRPRHPPQPAPNTPHRASRTASSHHTAATDPDHQPPHRINVDDG